MKPFVLSILTITLIIGGCTPERPRHYEGIPKENSNHTERIAVDTVDSKKEVHSMKVVPIGPLNRTFNDLNDTHLDIASGKGISPITETRDIMKISRPIVKVESCNDFYVEPLRHSYPFLCPEAEELLHDIGRSFTDSVMARSGKHYTMRVTSLLRTTGTISSLRRRNINSTQNSAHVHGLTFDISYVKFRSYDPDFVMSQGDLKNVLAEVVNNYKKQGRCYVKFERKQGCFHITAIP